MMLMVSLYAVHAQVKDLNLSSDAMNALLKSADVIQSIDNPSSKQIDSVTNLYSELNFIGSDEREILYSFIVPQLVPEIKTNRAIFVKCEPFAKKYVNKMAPAASAIVEKYPNTSEEILLENLNVFFQLYLYLGLKQNMKFGSLDKIPANEISIEGLDKLFIEARGSAADDMIYFTMRHSFTKLFTLLSKEYKIPTFNYSNN